MTTGEVLAHEVAEVPVPAKTAKRRGSRRGDLLWALIFIAPASIGFVAFFALPAVRGLFLSFTDYNLLSPAAPRIVGFDNYARIFADPIFYTSLRVTGLYVVINIVVQTIVALGLALLMDRVTKRTVTKGIILMPYLIAPVVVALLWFWMLDTQLGIVNQFLDWIGIGKIAWFGNSALVIPTIALVNVWKYMGYTALLIYAGLQTIPPSLYEAAELDGASPWASFRRITLPLLRPVLVLVLITSIVGSFQVFDTVAVTSQGGPGNASRVIQLYIYEKAFGQNLFGYASALSVILFIILVVVAVLQFKFLRGRESDIA